MARPTPLIFDTAEALALLRESEHAECLAQERLNEAKRYQRQAERKLLAFNKLVEA